MKLRIPGWARNEAVPSDLYRFADKTSETPQLVRQRHAGLATMLDTGYATMRRDMAGRRRRRRWCCRCRCGASSPTIRSRRIAAASRCSAVPSSSRVEWPDNPSGHVRNLVLPDTEALTSEFRADLLNGVQVVQGRAIALARTESGAITRTPQPFTAIPYATWANRGRGEMVVWLPTDRGRRATAAGADAGDVEHGDDAPSSRAQPASPSTTARRRRRRTIRRSISTGGRARARPSGSSTRWRSRPRCPRSQVYWFDDTGRGQVRVPASWRVLYKDGDDVEAGGREGPVRRRPRCVQHGAPSRR